MNQEQVVAWLRSSREAADLAAAYEAFAAAALRAFPSLTEEELDDAMDTWREA